MSKFIKMEVEAFVQKKIDEMGIDRLFSVYSKHSCNTCYGRGYSGWVKGVKRMCGCVLKQLTKLYEIEKKGKENDK